MEPEQASSREPEAADEHGNGSADPDEPGDQWWRVILNHENLPSVRRVRDTRTRILNKTHYFNLRVCNTLFKQVLLAEAIKVKLP